MAHPQPTSWHQVRVGTGLPDLVCAFSEGNGLRVDCRDRVGSPGLWFSLLITTAW